MRFSDYKDCSRCFTASGEKRYEDMPEGWRIVDDELLCPSCSREETARKRLMSTSPAILVGTPIYGYCGGAFDGYGDSYQDRRIEAVGHDWIVTRNDSGKVEFVSFDSHEELEDFVALNSQKNEGEI